MKTIEAIMSRRSIRKFREDKDVPFEKLMDILEAGSWAPSAGNVQNVRFLVIRNPGKKAQIADACLGQSWIASASFIVIICNDPSDAVREFKEFGKKYSEQSCAAAAENILLAAQELGIGSCWVGAFDETALRDVVQLSNKVSPEIIIPLGYAYESPKCHRAGIDLMVHFDKWGNHLYNKGNMMDNMKSMVKKKLGMMNKKGSLP